MNDAKPIVGDTELYQRVFEKSWDSVLIISTQGYIVEANPAAHYMLKYSPRELIGKQVTEMIHFDYRHQWAGFLNEAKKSHIKEVRSESINICKDGQLIDVEITSSLLAFHGTPAVLAVVRDITERKRAHEALEARVAERTKELNLLNQELKDEIAHRKRTEDALLASKMRYRSLVDTIPHGIDEMDTNGNILFANPALHRIFGCKEGELIGTSVLDRVSTPEEKEMLPKHWKQLVEEQPEPTSYFGKKLNVNGQEIDVQVDWAYNRDANGKVVSFSTVVTDITKRKRAEEKLQQQRQELAHVSRVSMLGEMAAGLAHELNQPLSAIVNYTQGCIRRLRAKSGEGMADIVTAMEQVSNEAQRAGDVIRRIRSFVKKGEMMQEYVDVNVLLRESLTLFSFDTTRWQIQFSFDFAENLPLTFVDRVQLSQVFVNIIKNAIEALQKQPVEKRKIKMATKLIDHEWIGIHIQNSGAALSEEERTKIFAPFFTTKNEGLGIGLSISRNIMDAHGGSLGLCPEDDGGVCFEIKLPVRRDDQ